MCDVSGPRTIATTRKSAEFLKPGQRVRRIDVWRGHEATKKVAGTAWSSGGEQVV